MILLARRRTIPAHAPLIVSVPASLNVLGTLAGGGIQTANGGARAAFDQNGLHMYDGSNIQRLLLDPVTGAMRFYDTSSRQRILIDTLTSSIHLFDANASERVLIDALNSIIKIWDTAGIARAEMGHVVVNGISPDQYGFRANDASGNPLLDNLGPISGGVMSSLGVTDVGTQNFNAVAWATVTGSTISFTTSRQMNLLAIFLGTGKLTAGANNGLLRQNWSGSGNSGNLYYGGSTFTTCMGWRFFPAAAAGSYSMYMEASVDNALSTLQLTETALQLFRLGS